MRSLIGISALLLLGGCITDPQRVEPVLDNTASNQVVQDHGPWTPVTGPSAPGDLSETNAFWGGGVFLRYVYHSDRPDRVDMIHEGDTDGSPYMSFIYENDSSDRIQKVFYSQHPVNYEMHDSLIYSGDKIVQIISITNNNGQFTTDTVTFAYDSLNRLVVASNGGRTVKFEDYVGNNSTRVKYYAADRLQFDLKVTYDERRSPFAQLNYVNVIFFKTYNLEGLDFLMENNISEMTEDDYQSVVYTNTYHYSDTYDDNSRPTLSVRIRGDGSDGYKQENFFRYR